VAFVAKGQPKNFYYDASNMPAWLTPPWVTPAFRTGPLALPLPGSAGMKEGPMFMGIPPQPIVPFDTQMPTDNVPVSTDYANYPTASIPNGRFLTPGQAPPMLIGERQNTAQTTQAQAQAAGASFLETNAMLRNPFWGYHPQYSPDMYAPLPGFPGSPYSAYAYTHPGNPYLDYRAGVADHTWQYSQATLPPPPPHRYVTAWNQYYGATPTEFLY
jgi:hypothetical protein